MISRICTGCMEEKDEEQFYLRPGRLLRDRRCKKCKYAAAKKNPNRINSVMKYKNSEKGKLSDHKTNLRLHNISLEQYQVLLSKHSGRCWICNKEETRRAYKGGVRKLSLDHDHSCCPGPYSCGKCIRGLLCDGCNNALGRVQDSVEVLRKMISYLEEWNNK